MEIKAILFDSGKVLNKPASGHWFISPNFWEYVNKDKFDSIDKDKINMAFREAANKIDSHKLITNLEEEYKLAVVSDAWPSIFDVYEKNNLRKYFDSFIVSSMIGVCKPHKKMYESALDELGVKPEEAIFIDDSLKNCLGAMELGIKAYLLCREYEDYLWCSSIGKTSFATYFATNIPF